MHLTEQQQRCMKASYCCILSTANLNRKMESHGMAPSEFHTLHHSQLEEEKPTRNNICGTQSVIEYFWLIECIGIGIGITVYTVVRRRQMAAAVEALIE
jgi:hypothetical protein